jgi:hypothetical protein
MRLVYIVISALLVSCATSKMNVEKGTFQTIKPPNIYGNNRYLTKDINYTISYDANIGKNKTIPLPGIFNEHNDLPYSSANIHYRLIENSLGFQFSRAMKNDYDFYIGFGSGIQNFPYGFLMFGFNGKSIEVGGAAYWGLMIDKASYEGTWFYENEGFGFGWASHDEYIKLKDMKILHSYGGLTAYTSFYWEKFALNYSASIANPWLVTKLPVLYDKDSYDANISFLFPFLLMQDVGISYTPNKIKYRLGVNQITGIEFPGQYWGVSVQVAYGW